MSEIDKAMVVRLWNCGVPMKQIARTMPCSQIVARRTLLQMRNDGELPPRKRKRGADLVVAAYESGMHNPYEIAETYGYSPLTVKAWLQRAKVIKERAKHNWKKRDYNEQTRAILDSLESGTRICDICRQFGASRQWVYAVKKRSENNEQ